MSVAVGAPIALNGEPTVRETAESDLVLESSDAGLNKSFQWAKKQSLAFAFDGDPVGPWYEAALPGREAFCMRDVAHHCMGGHALGLARHNLNMLRKFAENISDSRDWCSYWEIDRYNRPAPVDYKNDAEFWYNLPANFDVLDACYRMYLWSGDLSYINDPAFVNFYDRTVTDYVQRWDLDIDRVMKRKRFINIRGEFDPKKKFQFFRGDPSYHESRDEFVLGVDLLATQYVAYLAYSRIQEHRGDADSAREYLKKAVAIKKLINQDWWDRTGQKFHSHLSANYTMQGQAGNAMLYRNAADADKAPIVLRQFVDSIRKRPSSGVEGQSHHPEILYRYGQPDLATAQILDLTRDGRERREYPEVPFSVVGAIVTGLMGINVEPVSALQSSEEPMFVDRAVRTLSGLGAIAEAEIHRVPVRANRITVRHEGAKKTVFTNESGPSLTWQAEFVNATSISVDGRPAKFTAGQTLLNRETKYIKVMVAPSQTVRVEAT